MTPPGAGRSLGTFKTPGKLVRCVVVPARAMARPSPNPTARRTQAVLTWLALAIVPVLLILVMAPTASAAVRVEASKPVPPTDMATGVDVSATFTVDCADATVRSSTDAAVLHVDIPDHPGVLVDGPRSIPISLAQCFGAPPTWTHTETYHISGSKYLPGLQAIPFLVTGSLDEPVHPVLAVDPANATFAVVPRAEMSLEVVRIGALPQAVRTAGVPIDVRSRSNVPLALEWTAAGQASSDADPKAPALALPRGQLTVPVLTVLGPAGLDGMAGNTTVRGTYTAPSGLAGEDTFRLLGSARMPGHDSVTIDVEALVHIRYDTRNPDAPKVGVEVQMVIPEKPVSRTSAGPMLLAPALLAVVAWARSRRK